MSRKEWPAAARPPADLSEKRGERSEPLGVQGRQQPWRRAQDAGLDQDRGHHGRPSAAQPSPTLGRRPHCPGPLRHALIGVPRLGRRMAATTPGLAQDLKPSPAGTAQSRVEGGPCDRTAWVPKSLLWPTPSSGVGL